MLRRLRARGTILSFTGALAAVAGIACVIITMIKRWRDNRENMEDA